jgi:hypothetical protein
MSNLRIKASLSGGTLTITGSGFPPNKTAVIQITRRSTSATVRSPPAQVDGDGNFTVSAPFCGEEGVGPGVYAVSATNGRPWERHEVNTQWSNNVDVTCGGSSPSEEEEEEHREEEEQKEEGSNSNEEAEASAGGEEEGEQAPAEENEAGAGVEGEGEPEEGDGAGGAGGGEGSDEGGEE